MAQTITKKARKRLAQTRSAQVRSGKAAPELSVDVEMGAPVPLRPAMGWVRARKVLLDQVKSEVLRRLGPEPKDLRSYARRYEKQMQKRWTVSSKAELLGEIERADIVYGGDFHAHGQSQRTHLKILRSLSHERPLILALEAFPVKSQKWLEAYQKGNLSLDELRRKAHWDRDWGFPWENYRPLLELARKRGFRLLALNTPGGRTPRDLRARENAAAKCIREALLRQPGALVYVIFGDLHLAPEHLPSEVRDLFVASPTFKDLTIYLNSERIYFQLAKKGLELTVDVVRMGADKFCVLSSPPWVQWQSYLLFLDKAADQDLGDGADGDDDYDHTDQIASLIHLAARDLGLQFKVDDLSVYSSDDNRVWQHLERHLKSKQLEVARLMLASGRSFFVPECGVGYLSRPTVNHAAHLAGDYIHSRLCGRERPLWDLPRDFKALVWAEAVAFFISKLINHKRQSETLTDLRAQLAMSGPQDHGREALKLALDHRMSELIYIHQGRRRAVQLRPRRRASYLEAARILGGMMGERLYLAHRSRKLSLKDILQWMKLDVFSRDFSHSYEEIVRLIGSRIGTERGMGRGRGALVAIKTKKERL